MTLTAFRAYVQATLEAGLGVPFVAGKYEGPASEQDFGCCWPEGVAEQDDILVENLYVLFRIFKRYDRSEEPENPADPTELETLLEQAQVALKEENLTGQGVWMGRVSQAEIDMDRQMVEGRVLGQGLNPGAHGA